jgi:hypothetical protein
VLPSVCWEVKFSNMASIWGFVMALTLVLCNTSKHGSDLAAASHLKATVT